MARDKHRILPFRIPFFRIFYSTTYTSLYLIVLSLLAITPASLIYTAIDAGAYQYIFMIGGVYVLTAVLAIFIYSSRLFTNRAVLAGVGKSWIPVENGEVGRNVRKMVVQALERSALIAFESRPRDLSREAKVNDTEDNMAQEEDTLIDNHTKPASIPGKVLKLNPLEPPWGHVEHRGWSSPSPTEDSMTPHIYYMTVIQELPNLIEARAASLAPQRLRLTPSSSSDEPLDHVQAIAMLSRPPLAGLRGYLSYLDSLDVIRLPENGEDFLALYEHARFSYQPLSEVQFHELMEAFAEFLSGMAALYALDTESRQQSMVDSGDGTTSQAPSNRSVTSISSNGSAIHHRNPRSRIPSVYALANQESHRTPTLSARQPSRTAAHVSSHARQDSVGSVLRRQRTADSIGSGSISSSIRSAQSVIRLKTHARPDQIPYEWVGDQG